MTRIEFIDILQRTLAGSLSGSSVAENVRYYQDYIDTQIRMGQSEEEVLARLGDPRLLARTIIEAGKHEGAGVETNEEVYEDGQQEKGGGKVYRMPGWLCLVLVVLVIIVIAGAAFSLLSALLPIIIPVVCVVMVIRLVQRRN